MPGSSDEDASPGTGGKKGVRDALGQEKAAELGRLAAAAARAMGCGDAGLEAAEQVIRAGLLRLGGSMLGELLAADNGYRGPRVPCGQGHEAVFVSYRDKSFDAALGLVTVARAWYHCAECRLGLAPRDAELGVAGASMSPGLAAMNDIAAAAAGAAAGRERARLIAARKVVPLPPSPLPDKLCVVIDGTGVPMTARETAGREGKGEDGRARTREVKLGVFFTQDKLGNRLTSSSPKMILTTYKIDAHPHERTWACLCRRGQLGSLRGCQDGRAEGCARCPGRVLR